MSLSGGKSPIIASILGLAGIAPGLPITEVSHVGDPTPRQSSAAETTVVVAFTNSTAGAAAPDTPTCQFARSDITAWAVERQPPQRVSACGKSRTSLRQPLPGDLDGDCVLTLPEVFETHARILGASDFEPSHSAAEGDPGATLQKVSKAELARLDVDLNGVATAGDGALLLDIYAGLLARLEASVTVSGCKAKIDVRLSTAGGARTTAEAAGVQLFVGLYNPIRKFGPVFDNLAFEGGENWRDRDLGLPYAGGVVLLNPGQSSISFSLGQFPEWVGDVAVLILQQNINDRSVSYWHYASLAAATAGTTPTGSASFPGPLPDPPLPTAAPEWRSGGAHTSPTIQAATSNSIGWLPGARAENRITQPLTGRFQWRPMKTIAVDSRCVAELSTIAATESAGPAGTLATGPSAGQTEAEEDPAGTTSDSPPTGKEQ